MVLLGIAEKKLERIIEGVGFRDILPSGQMKIQCKIKWISKWTLHYNTRPCKSVL